MANKLTINALLRANKRIKQKGSGKKAVKFAFRTNSKIRIKLA